MSRLWIRLIGRRRRRTGTRPEYSRGLIVPTVASCQNQCCTRLEADMLKKLFKFAFFSSLVYGFGALARQLFLGLGDETTGEFEIVTIMEGKQFASRAEGLWSGKVTTVMGGVELDLGDVVLAPGGADLAVFTVMGGVALRVPDTWIVETDGRAIIGGHNARVPARHVLPADAPVLRVHARTYFGGLDIAAEPVES